MQEREDFQWEIANTCYRLNFDYVLQVLQLNTIVSLYNSLPVYALTRQCQINGEYINTIIKMMLEVMLNIFVHIIC